MMATLTMAITNAKEVLEIILLALYARSEYVGVLIDFIWICRDIAHSGCKCILCNHILHYVSGLIIIY